MAIVLSGTTNDILVNGVSVATDAEVSSAVASGVAPKANTADLKEIGVGQTWQDVTASRASGVTYTNTTGKPIVVNVSSNAGTGSYNFFVNGVSIVGITESSASNNAFMGIIVPNGATYSTNYTSIFNWSELR